MRSRAPFVGLAIFAVAGVTLAVHAQTAADTGAVLRVRAHVEFLADDLLEGRETGTRGHELAARYVATTLGSYGFEPAGRDGSFFQPVPLRETRITSASVAITAPGGVTVTLAVPDDAVVVADAYRREAQVTAPVAFVGYGVSAPDLQYDDYAGIDVRGKVVVMLLNAPPQFPGEVRAHYGFFDEKFRTAARHGAVAAMFMGSSRWEAFAGLLGAPQMAWTDDGGEPTSSDRLLHARGALSAAGVEKLFAGAPERLADVYAAGEMETPRSFDLPAIMTITSASEHRTLTSPNVLGVFRGEDPDLAESYVLLTAHLDHVGIGQEVNGDRIYNGAFDNALGCGILLEVARTVASLPERPRRSLLLAFVTAEEKGLIGSDFLARNPPVPRAQLVASLNLDMPVLQWPLVDVVAVGSEHSTLGDIVERAVRATGLGLAPDPMLSGLFFYSDQYSFAKQGLPSVYLMPAFTSRNTGEDHGQQFGAFMSTHYHRPSDDLSLPMDPGAIEAFARVNTAIALAIANDPVRPAWKPGSFFGRMFGAAAGTP